MGAGTKPYVSRRHPAEGGKPAAPARAWSRTGQLPPPRVARIGAALRCSCNGNSHSKLSEDASCMAANEPINKQQDPIQPMVRQAGSRRTRNTAPVLEFGFRRASSWDEGSQTRNPAASSSWALTRRDPVRSGAGLWPPRPKTTTPSRVVESLAAWQSRFQGRASRDVEGPTGQISVHRLHRITVSTNTDPQTV